MPWRLVTFLIALAIFVLFAGFNLGNTSDISFGFATIPQVPIFISLFIAFLLGAIVVLPFVIFRSSKKRKTTPKIKEKDQSKSSGSDDAAGSSSSAPATEPHP